MSPLASLLLTLAALVVATNAEVLPPNCASALFGSISPHPVQFERRTFPAGGARVTIPNVCGDNPDGNYVVACNADPNGLAPDLRLVVPHTISPVDILCRDGCPSGGTIDIVQYCQ